MSDAPLSKPVPVPVTAVWLAENRQKQAAYAEQRRQHHARLDRAQENEDVDTTPIVPSQTMPPVKRQRRDKIIDPRQLKLFDM